MNEDEAALWFEWNDSQASESFHALLNHYHDWLVKLSERFYFEYYVSCYEIGDYLHWAMIGLIESIKRYQPIQGIKFQTYAFKRIRGEVINHINRATEELAQRKSFKNQMERIDSMVEYTESTDEFTKLYELTVGVMLGHLLEMEIEKPQENDTLMNEVYDKQLSINLSRLLEKLSKLQKNVLVYHYFYSFKFVEVGEILQLSKGRVSQLHASAMFKLREMLTQSEFEMYT